MLIYNMTLKINWDIQQTWLTWMQEVYIKNMMNTGCFSRFQLVRLLEIDEDDGPVYALQLYVNSREDYMRYVTGFLPGMQKAGNEKWGSDMISFSTLMEVIG